MTSSAALFLRCCYVYMWLCCQVLFLKCFYMYICLLYLGFVFVVTGENFRNLTINFFWPFYH